MINNPLLSFLLLLHFLSHFLPETLKSPEATAQLVDSIVEKNEQTGETSIKIPVESKETHALLIQRPVYFISEVLSETKIRYPQI